MNACSDATAANIAQNNIETVTIQQSSSNSTVDNGEITGKLS